MLTGNNAAIRIFKKNLNERADNFLIPKYYLQLIYKIVKEFILKLTFSDSQWLQHKVSIKHSSFTKEITFRL